MNNHLRKAVVVSLAVVASLGMSGCIGGGGGIFGLFEGSSLGDVLASFGGPDDSNGNNEDPGLFSLARFGGEEEGWEGEEYYGEQAPPPPAAVVTNPEPTSIGLFGAGLVALGASRRRKKAARRSTRG